MLPKTLELSICGAAFSADAFVVAGPTNCLRALPRVVLPHGKLLAAAVHILPTSVQSATCLYRTPRVRSNPSPCGREIGRVCRQVDAVAKQRRIFLPVHHSFLRCLPSQHILSVRTLNAVVHLTVALYPSHRLQQLQCISQISQVVNRAKTILIRHFRYQGRSLEVWMTRAKATSLHTRSVPGRW